MAYRATKALVALLAITPLVDAHSWVEFLKRINSDGSFSKDTGYPIPYIARGAAGYSDDAMLNKILDKTSNPSVCKQGNFQYSKDAPRLAAAPGDFLAMQYQENGHVTQPGITKRPFRGGNVYVYGTLKSTKSTGINDVLYAWNAQGTGGDKKGQLLASHFYDDGQCYQNLGGVEPDPQAKIYTDRHNKFKVDAVDCQSDFQLPANLPENGIYNLMWVWDWPLITGDHTNVTEIYTSCAEIQLKPKKQQSAAKIQFAADNHVTNAAIKSQVHTLIEAVTLGQGTNSPPAPTGAATTKTNTAKPPAFSGPATITVTVTAPAVTTTIHHTVTVGNGLFPTDVPIDFPPNFPFPSPSGDPIAIPSSFPIEDPFPTLPVATPSTAPTQKPTTAQTSVKPASTTTSASLSSPTLSSSSLSSSSSLTVTVDEGIVPGVSTKPAVTHAPSSSTASILSSTSSSSSTFTKSSVSSSAPSTTSSAATDDGVVPGFPAQPTPKSSSTRSSTSSSATTEDGGIVPFPTRTASSSGAAASSTSASTSKVAGSSTAAVPSSASLGTVSTRIPSTLQTLVRPSSTSSLSSTASAVGTPSKSAAVPSVVTSAPAASHPHSSPGSPTTLVPVTSIAGFLP